jgi:hypothetical protein
MNQPVSNRACSLERQLMVALKAYTSRWEFWAVALFTIMISLTSLGLTGGPRHVAQPQLQPPREAPTAPSTLHAGNFTQTITDAWDINVPQTETFVTLRGTRVSDITLQALLESPQINTLHLIGTSVTDVGLANLAELPNLKSLAIFGANVSGQGFAGLADRSKLVSVHLSQTKLNAEGIRALAQQQSLRDLRIEVTPLFSKDLVPLRELKELRSISLDFTNADDHAVDWLVELPHLKFINVAHTYISQEGARRLRGELPGIHIAGVSSIGQRLTQPQEESARLKKQRHAQGVSRIPIFLLPCFFLSLILGMHLKLQFAAPRSQMMPDFARAHLIVAGCLLGSAAALLTLAAGTVSDSSLIGLLAIELACFAWFLWMAQLNSILMFFSTMIGFGWLFFGAGPATHDRVSLLFLSPTVSAASIVLLLAALSGLTALAVRLVRFREEMSEYGMVFSFDMIWDWASGSSNRQRQRIEANAISKSVFNAWIVDTQFDFAIRHLPTSWLPRAMLLLQVSHGFAIFWMIPILVGVFWVCVSVMSGLGDGRTHGSAAISAAPIFLTSLIPMMCLSAINGQWLQHWRWFSNELLRPATRQQYVKSILSTMALDGLVALGIPIVLLLVLAVRGFTVATLTTTETLLLSATHITAHLITSLALLAWLTSYRKIWLMAFSLAGSMGLHAGLTGLSCALGVDWLPVTLPCVLMGSLIIASRILRTASHRWNTLEFA